MQIKLLKINLALVLVPMMLIFGLQDLMAAAGNSSCKASKLAFRDARAGRDKAKASMDIIDSCELGSYARLAAFDEAFGTSFDSRRSKMPKGGFDTAVLYFEPQKKSMDDSVASAHSGWYLVIKYYSNGIVFDYMISSAHK